MLVILLGAWITLTALTRDLRLSQDGFMLVVVLAFAGVGLVVARQRPTNPVGWILAGVALVLLLNLDLKLYAVLDYRQHGGSLPLGRVALDFNSMGLVSLVLALLAVLLFPDGILTRRWRRMMWVYVAIGTVFLVGQFMGQATLSLGRHITVNALGKPPGSNQPGDWGLLFLLVFPLFGFWVAFVGRQVAVWRHADGVRREQQKWLMSGAALCVIGTIAFSITAKSSGSEHLIAEAATMLIAAFPLSIAVGILRYRLYEIDRLISRTISYALVTGVLVGLFLGLVLVATRVLPFSSPVAVAASTLAAAALFNPLRRRVQRVVDRRFNRARYDARDTVSAYSAKLRDELDLEGQQSLLQETVSGVFEPAHSAVWVRTDA
jgi:hypothetical protein